MTRAALLPILAACAAVAADYPAQHEALVAEVQEYAALAGDGRLDDRVIDALRTVGRHEFVPESERRFAYENRPLPIGYGQTISQPYVVALMTDLLDPGPNDVVLEVGTGSGYQAAILSGLVAHVYTIEIIQPLWETATRRLADLGFDNVTTRLGDGYYGWKDHAPFDAIIVTAAPSHVPPPLVQQLRPGGRLVIPVGGRFVTQQLLLIEKASEGEIITRQIATVRFVPLTGGH
jgi:protein-L-isoaspartate(D-aspartate) O-methyltransferase